MLKKIGFIVGALALTTAAMAADKPAAQARQEMEGQRPEPTVTVTEHERTIREPRDIGYRHETRRVETCEAREESSWMPSRGTTKPAAEARMKMER